MLVAYEVAIDLKPGQQVAPVVLSSITLDKGGSHHITGVKFALSLSCSQELNKDTGATQCPDVCFASFRPNSQGF